MWTRGTYRGHSRELAMGEGGTKSTRGGVDTAWVHMLHSAAAQAPTAIQLARTLQVQLQPAPHLPTSPATACLPCPQPHLNHHLRPALRELDHLHEEVAVPHVLAGQADVDGVLELLLQLLQGW